MAARTSISSKRAAVRRFRVGKGEGSVSAQVRLPAGYDPQRSPGLVMAHGAGSDMLHAFMTYYFDELGRDFLTMRFNFLYREQGRKAPDAAKRLQATYRQALAALRAKTDIAPQALFAGGKSMGGRMATHLAAAGEDLAGLVLFGYPLHPPGKTDSLRAAHLVDIRCPMLFIQGTRDRLCDLDLLHRALEPVAAPCRVHVIEGGDHSFKIPKRLGRPQEDVMVEIRDVVGEWMRENVVGAR